MIILIIIATFVLTAIITVACAYVWHIHGLELAVFFLGGASLALLSILSIQYAITR